jgi:hypothetical protein
VAGATRLRFLHVRLLTIVNDCGVLQELVAAEAPTLKWPSLTICGLAPPSPGPALASTGERSTATAQVLAFAMGRGPLQASHLPTFLQFAAALALPVIPRDGAATQAPEGRVAGWIIITT